MSTLFGGGQAIGYTTILHMLDGGIVHAEGGLQSASRLSHAVESTQGWGSTSQGWVYVGIHGAWLYLLVLFFPLSEHWIPMVHFEHSSGSAGHTNRIAHHWRLFP